MRGIQARGGRLLNSKIEKRWQVSRRGGLLTIGGKFRWQGIELSLVPVGKYTPPVSLDTAFSRYPFTRIHLQHHRTRSRSRGRTCILSILYCGHFSSNSKYTENRIPKTNRLSHYKRVSPNALRTNEHPARMVSAAPTVSRLGFTSTRSMATRLPVSWTHSQMKSPSRRVRPPRTGVPVLGAHWGSSASTSNERWMGVSLPM